MKKFCCHVWWLLFMLGVQRACALHLTAHLSQSGLHGTVSFEQEPGGPVLVKTSLQSVYEASEWSWSVRRLPVDYLSLAGRCDHDKLGDVVYALDEKLGPLSLPANGSSQLEVPRAKMPLTGEEGLWGKSLLLQAVGDGTGVACGTITVSGNADEKFAEARFSSPVAGSVFLSWVGDQSSDNTDALLHVDLYHVTNATATTRHPWKIYTTDILDSEADKARDNCNFLQVLYAPGATAGRSAIGDLDVRVGEVAVSGGGGGGAGPRVYHDAGLNAVSVDVLGGPRSLYLVVFDHRHRDSFLACAKIRKYPPTVLKALINTDGVKGDVTLVQRSPFDPTWLQMNLTSTRDELLGRPATTFSVYKVHDLPPLPRDMRATERCLTAGEMYNPGGRTAEEATGSQDSYAVGDLSGKHNKWRRPQTLPELFPRLWDAFLPLQGPHSVAHRTLVLYKPAVNGSASSVTQEPWMCGTLLWYAPGPDPWKVPVFTAEVVYRYPIVGRIVFRQPAERPWADTTVLVEYLVHADGTSQNNTFEHRWGVHDSPPGKDFYDWQNRCLSAGGIYNPHKVYVDRSAGEPDCDGRRLGRCPVGLLSARHGTFGIAGRKGNSSVLTRRLYTDRQLALGGTASILGRSLVIYDDHGPKARGERLACSVVGGVYRRKAVAKDWFGNGQPATLKGRIEMLQQTEHDVTDLDVKFEGLDDNSDYRIHKVSVEMDLEFPCEETAVYGTWDPLGVGPARLPEPGRGSTDQYPMGDLSGKFGTLEGSALHASAHNDSRLPLFGTDAVIGRSVVVYKKNKVRWACSTIERGYSPSEARELRAIASFHHPLGFAYGFIRMTQLVYRDGSTSDTVIEVKLRHPGKHDRNVTRNHNWAIFVNPVGVDATVKVLNTRCVAGGYMWNPYYTQLADPLNEDLYRDECGPDNPLRCYVGDISGRMGTIDIGTQRQVFTDSNFPLEGTVSALGRSIVIFTKNRGGERFACAKIEPDSDIIKYANIEKPPRFVLAQFIAEVREIMGIPEWMLSVDSRKTKTLHNGGCVQFLLHFKGPIANQLELDFSRLMNAGSLPAPTLYIPGYVPSDKRKKRLSYRPCGARDPNQKSRKKSFLGSRAHRNRWSSIYCYGLAVLLLNFYLWAGQCFDVQYR